VKRFASVQEEGWRAGAGESGCDFSTYQARFAQACDYYSSLAGVEKFYGFFEAGVEAFNQARDCFGFYA
jgi:hypothetical protein